MSPLEWQELSDFFDQISDLPPEERSRRLQEAVSIRPDWQPYLEQMIQEYESASDFLRTPAAQVSELWPPARSVFQEGELLEGRFQVIRCIGRGGMGEVYEAEDPVFGKVALKTLLPWLADKPDFVEQFKREATRSRRISHNNVCRVHDLHKLVRPAGDEVWYYSMELLCGETLACHLEAGVLAPVDQSTNFLHQIIDALEAAHSRGVLHRDLKPANIFLERREPYPRVVVTDFGIAGDFSLTETLAQLTEGSDSAMGTLWYMSPEQLEQLPLTPASDLYSLGLIAYEMLCGQRPFSRMSPIAAAIRRTRERPPSLKELVPAIPEQLDRAVMRSLEPKAKDRYESAPEMRDAFNGSLPIPPTRRTDSVAPKTRRSVLIGVAGGAAAAGLIGAAMWGSGFRARVSAPQRLRIAVLPFRTRSSKPEDEYLTNGVAEQITSSLTAVRSLSVVAHASALRVEGHKHDHKLIGRLLDVVAYVTGSVQRNKGQVRISAELISADTGEQMWSATYDRAESQMAAIQDDIARAVAAVVQPAGDEVFGGKARMHSDNAEAYDLYLRGTFQLRKRSPESLKAGLANLERARSIDPGFVMAHIAVADAYLFLADYGVLAPQEAVPKARAAALRALELGRDLGEAHATLGQLFALFDWDWDNAEAEFRRAVELNRNLAQAYHWYANLIMRRRRMSEAFELLEQALRLNPISPPIQTLASWHAYYSRDYPRAVQAAVKALELDGGYTHAHTVKSLAHARLGEAERALKHASAAAAIAEDSYLAARTMACVHAILGQKKETEELLGKMLAHPNPLQPGFLALIFADLRQPDEAFRWLETAFDQRDTAVLNMGIDPALQPYHEDQRFVALMKKLKL